MWTLSFLYDSNLDLDLFFFFAFSKFPSACGTSLCVLMDPPALSVQVESFFFLNRFFFFYMSLKCVEKKHADHTHNQTPASSVALENMCKTDCHLVSGIHAEEQVNCLYEQNATGRAHIAVSQSSILACSPTKTASVFKLSPVMADGSCGLAAAEDKHGGSG